MQRATLWPSLLVMMRLFFSRDLLLEESYERLPRSRRGDLPVANNLLHVNGFAIDALIRCVVGLHGCRSQGSASEQASFGPRVGKNIRVDVVVTDCLGPVGTCNGRCACAKFQAASENFVCSLLAHDEQYVVG